MRRPTSGPWRTQAGAAMLIVLGILFALSLLALAALQTSDVEMGATGNMTRKTRAFLAAEAGLARADYILKQNPHRTSADTLTAMINADTVLPNARFRVRMDTTLPLRRVVSTGRSDPGEAAIQVLYRHSLNPINIWNNAIFAGQGQKGQAIAGNVGVHGSVHILGSGEEFNDLNSNGRWDPGEPFVDANHDGIYDPPLAPTTPALDMTGTATISNNYNGLAPVLASRLPPLSTVPYGGENVQSLNAEVRVKRGNVVLDGNAKVGQPNVAGGSPPVKETMDGVYVTDGFTGSAATAGVFSDNGFANAYDIEDATPLKMPNLDLPYTDRYGTYHATYMDYLRANALVINGNLSLTAGVPRAIASNAKGSIALDGAGNLQVSGVVYVRGNITISGASPIQYQGRATLVSEGNVTVNADFYSRGRFATEDVVGLIAYKRMELGTSAAQLKLAGAFFAQEEVVNAKQNQLAGSIVSNYFSMKNVPDIFQVPALTRNLPPGMPGADDVNVMAWRRVPRSWVELN